MIETRAWFGRTSSQERSSQTTPFFPGRVEADTRRVTWECLHRKRDALDIRAPGSERSMSTLSRNMFDDISDHDSIV